MKAGKIKKWILRIFTSSLILLSLVILFFTFLFYVWRVSAVDENFAETLMINTGEGFIEFVYYDNKNENKTIFYSHGNPDSFVNPIPIRIFEPDYGYLSMARPGYFNTSLSIGKTPGEQADLYARLMDELEIGSVIMWGVAGGAPAALEFAVNYPDRCSALVLQSAVLSDTDGRYLDRFSKTIKYSEFGFWIEHKIQSLFSGDERMKENMNRYMKSSVPFGLINRGLQNDREQLANFKVENIELVSCPVLVIHGTNDQKSHYSDIKRMMFQLPKTFHLQLTDKNHYYALFSGDEKIRDEVLFFLNEVLNE